MPRSRIPRAKLRKIKLLLLDVDGVMTDGSISYTERGDELKRFNIQDGYGIIKARRSGLRIGIITGRVSEIVGRRAQELGIEEVYQNLDNKLTAFEEIRSKLGVDASEVAFIGDDEPDLPVLERVGFSACPADAVEVVRRRVDYVCRRAGGMGAVREVIDAILKEKR